MENRKTFIALRYILIFLMILNIILKNKYSIDSIAVILLMLFIINGHIRVFYIPEKDILILCTIVLESTIIYLCYTNYNGIFFLYLLPMAIDIAYLLMAPFNYAAYGIIVALMAFIGYKYPSMEFFQDIVIILAIGSVIVSLSEYVKKEYKEKIKAQNLYNQLRSSEEKLKRANRDLEEYASSIEELTLLKERNRISREIHDSVGHGLSTIIVQLGAIEKIALGQNNKTIENLSSNLRDFARNSLEEVRRAVRELKPNDYEEYEGLFIIEDLIKNFQKLTRVDIKLLISRDKWKLNSKQLFAIHRVIQEFLSNSVRHGKASAINIFMNYHKDHLVLTLKDNGSGSENVIPGMGLMGISERITELGGNVEYSTSPGEGFILKIVIKRIVRGEEI